VFGKDPREYSVMTKEFIKDEKVGREGGREGGIEGGRKGEKKGKMNAVFF